MLGMGGNTKAALMRIGIAEMERFCNEFLEGIEKETFSESCGASCQSISIFTLASQRPD